MARWKYRARQFVPALFGEEEAEADMGVFVIGFYFDCATKL